MSQIEALIFIVLFIVVLTLLSKVRSKPEGPNISQANGKVVHIYKSDERYVVIAEFFVNEQPFRSYTAHYHRKVELGDEVEVFYDNRDPRESQLGDPL